MGGGKGGVGKSVVAANLGVALATRGHSCVVVDADLGGANQHILLGVTRPTRTLSHFLIREVEQLGDVTAETSIRNLRLVSGARALLDVANLKYQQKQRMLRHLRLLDADHVILDLGAGSAFNVLDFFLAADHPVLVISPEPTAVENAYHFLKAAFFRFMSQSVKDHPSRAVVQYVFRQKEQRNVYSPRRLVSEVCMVDPEVGRRLQERAEQFAPVIIVNQARTSDHRALGHSIRTACRSYLGSDVRYLGALLRDDCVRESVERRTPVLELLPGSPFALDLDAMVDMVLVGSPGAAASPVVRMPVHDERVFASHGDPLEVDRESEPWIDSADVPDGTAAAELDPDPPPLSEPGAFLRHRRERLGLTLVELARRTRIVCLEHLERETHALLPPEPYVRGFVHEYARVLGIREAEALTRHYLERLRRAAQAA